MEISGLLSEALSGDQQRRNQAELNIDAIATQNFGIFLINCSQVLCDENQSKGVRQISATLIKNMILYTAKYKGQWEKLNSEIKLQIKQHVLSTLASSDKDIRKAAGLAVAGICKLELPLGEWHNIISVLCETSNNENKFIQLASLTTLGFISQEITQKDLNDNQLCSILSCLYGMLIKTTDLELQEVSLNAMLNFIPFTKIFFENKDQKNVLLDVIFKYTNNPEIKLRTIAIQCVLDIGRLYYDYLDDNLNDLMAITKLHLVNDDESVAIIIYEFWCSIGDIEIARLDCKKSLTNISCKNYCNRSYSQLLEIIFQHLLSCNIKSDDSWTLSKSAACLLSILSQCCDYNLIQEVITFIGSNICLTSTTNKEAAILSFGAILDTRHMENMTSLVMNSIDTLIDFLLDSANTGSLKESTSWVIEKISELYGQQFLNYPDIFEKLYKTIISLLDKSKRKVVCHLINTIHFFSIAFKPAEGQNSNLFSAHVKYTLEILLKLAFTPKSYDSSDNVAMCSFYAIGSVVENSASDTRFIIQSFFNDLFEAFKSTLNPMFFENEKMRFDYQSWIASTMEPCLISGYVCLNYEGTKEILSIIIQTFKERNSVYEEGLMAASALGLALGEQFDNLVGDFGSFLIYALNSISDTSLCKTAIHSTSDLIRSIGPSFSKYLDQIIPIILGILSNTEADKLLKPHSFNVISDVFVMCKQSSFIYFNDVMDLIGSALEAATFITQDKEDYESIEYFASLREHIVECLTCIFHTIKDLNKEEEFKKYVLAIVNFVNRINQNEFTPSTELVKNSLGLIADFCETYKFEMKPVINIPTVELMIKNLKDNKSSRIVKTLNWSQKVISEAIK